MLIRMLQVELLKTAYRWCLAGVWSL